MLPEAGIAFAPVGNLDGDLELRPQAHIFVASKALWFDITDGFPQYVEPPPH